MAAFGLFFLALSSTLLLHFNISTAQTYISSFCFEDYSTNSTYDANVDLVLSSMANITGNDTRFYTNTVGRFPDIVYGIYQCRGDIALEDCKKCAETSARDLKFRCHNKKEITIWYHECWMRYSNKQILSTMIGDPKQYISVANNVSNPNLFRSTLNELMDGLAARAVNSTNMFALGEYNVSNSQTIYGLVQCSQDLSKRDCGRCLNKTIRQIPPCCDSKDGGRILKPSCILWFEVYKFFEANARPTIFSSSEAVITTGQKKSSRAVIIIVLPTVTVAVFLSIIIIFFCIRRNKDSNIAVDVDVIPTVESLQFNFGIIIAATDNFSDGKKLGEGGYGAVYKGNLSDGREIAVKRLCTNSGGGAEEFKNEVLLLAKLHHRNLVRLLGFCLEGNEKLLIYEYVPNASLDRFIFDTMKRTSLDWERRYNIIGGIARGLLYLHEDSRDRIIHRNLKASNILLDEEMNPKISDFGMAKLFPIDQTQGATSKIIGTYGYMAPEYVMHGQFSAKTDVFSFGVLVLEIITGEKNDSFHRGERAQDLLSHVWRQWEEGAALDLLEPTLRDSFSRSEVMKCIQMGLLCVQEDVASRPIMASVVLMLNSYSITLPLPSVPAFFVNTATDFSMIGEDERLHTTDTSQSVLPSESICSSINDASITEFNPT